MTDVAFGRDQLGDDVVIHVLNLADYGTAARELVGSAGKNVRTTSRVKNGLGFILSAADADAAGYNHKKKPRRTRKPTEEPTETGS